MTDKIFKKGYKLSSDKIKMTPEIQKSIDDVIEKQKEFVSCVCKIPEPRLKVSENGTHAYCNNCAKTYWQK